MFIFSEIRDIEAYTDIFSSFLGLTNQAVKKISLAKKSFL